MNACLLPYYVFIPAPLILASLFVLFAGIPLAVVSCRSMSHNRFLLLLSFLAITLLLVVPGLHMFRFASLVVLFADLLLTIAVWRLTPPPRIRLRLLLPFLAIALLLVFKIGRAHV